MLTYRLQRAMRVNTYSGGIDTHLNDKPYPTDYTKQPDRWFSVRTERNISTKLLGYTFDYNDDNVFFKIRVDVYSMFSTTNIDYAFTLKYELPC